MNCSKHNAKEKPMKHIYEVEFASEVYWNGRSSLRIDWIVIEANTRSQARRIAGDAGLVVRSVNMIG